jgi:hypothetical protein
MIAMALAVASPCFAQIITDGDTLKQSGVTYRPRGIDAPELAQTCPDGWAAGSLGATRLQALTAGRLIICQEKDQGHRLPGNRAIVCHSCNQAKGSMSLQRFANRLARAGDPRAGHVAAFFRLSMLTYSS